MWRRGERKDILGRRKRRLEGRKIFEERGREVV